MMKKICLSVIICCMLFATAVTCYAAEAQTAASVMVPVTGDVTSIVALSLVGVAAIGGYLLRKAK